MKSGIAIAKMMRDYGVERVFGVPGGQTLPFYMGILETEGIDHVLARCERCAAFMADAYARVTFKPGVCDATVGPGATNLVSGVGEAWGNSIPLVVLTSDIDSSFQGKNASQCCDQRSMLRPFVKESLYTERAEDVPWIIRRAFRVATTGRPGPVHVDLPANTLAEEHEYTEGEMRAEGECGTFPAHRVRPALRDVKKAVGVMTSSERPVLIAGGGVILSQAWNELLELAELLMAPVATTMTGKGSIPEDHPLALGVCGGLTKTYSNQFIEEADAVVLVGCKAGQFATDNWSLPRPGTRVVHVDVDPKEIGRNFETEVGVVGDARLAIQEMVGVIKEKMRSPSGLERMPRMREIEKAAHEFVGSIEPEMSSSDVPIKPQRVMKEIRNHTERGAILVSDASQSSFWCSTYYRVLPGGRFIAPRGLAGIGYGFPATIAATMVTEKQVIGIGGDGGFGMVAHEMELAVRNGVPAVYVVLNNRSLGWIKWEMSLLWDKRYISVDFNDVDYGKVAEAYGGFGMRIERPEEIQDALREAYDAGRPSVIDVLIDPWAAPPVKYLADALKTK